MRRPLFSVFSVLASALCACGAGSTNVAAKRSRETAVAAPGFRVVAEGPCGKLSIARAGARTWLVYGDTGYDLHDWSAGQKLAAAESMVEVRGRDVARNKRWLAGLPTNQNGYVAADLELGGAEGNAFLLAITTNYASRSRGALFTREASAYIFEDVGWKHVPDGSVVMYPERAGSLPALAIETMCQRPGYRFERTTATSLASGHVFIAGRCQDESHVNALAHVLVAHGSPNASAWDVSAPPEVGPLDGIVNLGLYAASETDVHLVAWEPFKPRDQRQPYLAHFDGKAWAQVETGIPGGLMSVSGTPSGALFIAAGAALYKRESAAAAWKPVPLPALLFSSTPARGAVWIHTVRAISEDDVWVEGTYRVKLPDPKSGDVEARASALYHWGTPMPTLYCDAREPAENALSIVEKP